MNGSSDGCDTQDTAAVLLRVYSASPQNGHPDGVLDDVWGDAGYDTALYVEEDHRCNHGLHGRAYRNMAGDIFILLPLHGGAPYACGGVSVLRLFTVDHIPAVEDCDVQ